MTTYPLRRRAACLIHAVSIVATLPAALARAQQSEEMQIVVAAEQLVNQQKPDEALAAVGCVLSSSWLTRKVAKRPSGVASISAIASRVATSTGISPSS